MWVMIMINGWMKQVKISETEFHSRVVHYCPKINVQKLFSANNPPSNDETITTYTCVYLGRKIFGYFIFEFGEDE